LGVRSLVLLVCTLAPAAALQAQPPTPADYEGRTITRVDFDPPDQPLPRDELNRRLPLRSGSPLQAADVRAAMQSLYLTGRYTNIVVSAEPDGTGVAVRIATELAWFVAGVSFDGAVEPPNRGQLQSATKLELGAPFTSGDVHQGMENAQERLRANGLYRATIDPHVENHPKTEEGDIQFRVHSGARAHFDGIEFTGAIDTPMHKVIHESHWMRGMGPFDFKFLGWRQVTENRVTGGVQSLRQYFQRGDHLQARVTLERLEYHPETNRVTPVLSVDPGPRLEVNLKGASLSQGRLRQLIPVYQERSVDRSLLMEGKRNLTDYFEGRGYFDTQIDFTEDTGSDGHRIVDYTVELGKRHRLKSVTISGNKFFDTESLRERLYLTPAQFPRFRYGRYSHKLTDRDKESIADLYRANGFRDVEVSATAEDDYKGTPGYIAVHFEVKEGPQWLIDKLDLEGVPEGDAENLRAMLQSTEGQAFSDVNVAVDRDSILTYYYNNGYPNASFDSSQTPAAEPHHVNLRYQIVPGKREYTRGMLVRGLVTTNPGLVARRFTLNAGEPISQKKIADGQQKLYDLGIFSKVETALQNPNGEEESKYVILHLDEANRYSFTAGIGAQLGRIGGGTTTFDDPAGTTGFSPRVSLGISRINFLGVGQTVSLQTRFSTLQQRALVTYLVPQFTGNDKLSLTFSALFDNSHDIRTFASRRLEGSVQLAQKLNKVNSIQYRFTFRRVTIDMNSLKISPELIPLLSQPDRVGIVSMTFIQDHRDDSVNTHRGYYNTIDVGEAFHQLGSQTEFARILLRNSTYHKIGKDLVLARTVQFGYIQRISGLKPFPLAERFFSGGATSNRAFPDNQAGPRDLETGFPLGGNALLFHSTELRFPLIGDNLGGVLFHDLGNVYSDIRNISFRFRQNGIQDFDYTVHSFGFGIRYSTPVGPIRGDISFSPDSPRFFGFQGTRDQLLLGQGTLVNQRINMFQFHFSLGQTF
jgi:outer membrane protein insertion porin family